MDNLPRFIDRWTIEYVHTYPHPVERVWRAITDPKEFGVWFIPGSAACVNGQTNYGFNDAYGRKKSGRHIPV